MRKIDIKKQKERIVEFIRSYTHDAGFKKGIIGLSGGLDSSVSAYLSTEALGKENVIGAILPYKTTSITCIRDAELVIQRLGIKSYTRDISPIVDSYFATYEENATSLRRGNFMARVRMCVLYDLSAKEQALVIGTGNKTELYLGYVTQFGDSACALEPIGHLYKTEVRELAKLLGLPKQIIEKIPSADLWQGQTDEGELGITYEKADEILYRLVDEKLTEDEMVKQGFDYKDVQHVKKLIKNSQFKRRLPAMLED
ncbi:MAG: NAD+ synthase [Candidatus Cloacimonadia bacterium]